MNTSGTLLSRMAPALIILIIASVGIGAYFIIRYQEETREVTLDLEMENEVYSGTPFEVSVSVSNNTDGTLKDAVISLNLPPTLLNASSENESRLHSISEAIGNLGVGSVTKQVYKLLGLENNGQSEKVNVSVAYIAPNGTHFEEKFEKEVTVKQSPIEINVEKPEQIVNNSAFEFEIKYQNNSEFDFENLSLQASYPLGFKFVSASLSPNSLNNYWQIGELKAKSKGSLRIKGMVVDSNLSSFEIPIIMNTKILNREYSLARATTTLTLTPSPINIEIRADNERGGVKKIGDRINYVIKFENRSGISLADVVVKTTLSGELFDLGTLETNGRAGSSSGTIIWDSENAPTLRALDSGASEEMRLAINVKPAFPIQRLNDKNYYLRLNVEVESPSVPSYVPASKTKSNAVHEIKIAGATSIEARAFYRDAMSGIVNNGALPPKAGQKTQYTVRWIIRNYAVDTQNITVKTKLEPNVSWTGKIKSSISAPPRYDEKTREVIWEVGSINANKGVITDPVEATFQIEAVPNASDVGNFEPLIKETTLEALDTFTGSKVNSFDTAISTLLTDDPTVTQNDGKVSP